MPSTRFNLRSGPQAEPLSTRNRGTPNNNGGGITKRTTPRQRNHQSSPNALLKALRASLPGPFSELTQYRHIPLADIHALVYRSAETRRAEYEIRPACRGVNIPRPSNPFILYRKCYFEQAKAFCKGQSETTQAYSAVLGTSWKMESAMVKAGFKEWAEIEKEAHLKAFPGYRYLIRSRKKVVPGEDPPDEDPSDSEDEGNDDSVGAPALAFVQEPGFTAQQGMGYMPMSPAEMGWQPEQGLFPAMQGSDFNPQWALSFPMPYHQQAMPQPLLPMNTPLYSQQQTPMDMDLETLFALPTTTQFPNPPHQSTPVLCSRCKCEVPATPVPLSFTNTFQGPAGAWIASANNIDPALLALARR